MTSVGEVWIVYIELEQIRISFITYGKATVSLNIHMLRGRS